MATPKDAGFIVEMMDPKDLMANPLNPAVHTDRQKDALATSIEEHGWLAAPIWNATTRRLVDGHARVEEAKRRCEASIPVRVIRVSEEEEKRILASFDRIGELKRHDDSILAKLLSECTADGADVPAGWNEDELGDLLLKVDRAAQRDVSKSTEKEYGESQPSPRAPDDDEGPTPTGEPSHVKMVQLFLTTETEPEFQAVIAKLKEQWGTENVTDTVVRAINDCLTEEGLA
jgi:hypothetical protein